MAEKIRVSVDLNKITKSKCVKHSNGALYYNFEVIKKKTPGKFGDTHMVIESLTKDEWTLPKDQQPETNYIGSGKEVVFNNTNSPKPTSQKPASAIQDDDDDDDFPF